MYSVFSQIQSYLSETLDRFPYVLFFLFAFWFEKKMLSDETLMRDDIVRRYPFHRGNYTMQGNKVVSRNGTPPIETDQYTCLENSLYFGRPLMLLEQVILKFSSADGWCPYDDTLLNQTFTVKMASRSHGKYDLSWQEQQILKTAEVQTTVIIEVNDFPSAVNGRVGRPRASFYLGKVSKVRKGDFELHADRY